MRGAYPLQRLTSAEAIPEVGGGTDRAPAGSVPRLLEIAPLVLLIAGSEALGIDGGTHSAGRTVPAF